MMEDAGIETLILEIHFKFVKCQKVMSQLLFYLDDYKLKNNR